ncbi:hypothetical protein LINPERPRIM_LOCUS28491, partial [Linum perenne]
FQAYPVRACNQSKRTTAQARPCTVTTTWLEFRKVVRVTNKARETVPLSLPSYSFESQVSIWVLMMEFLSCPVIIVPLYMLSDTSIIHPCRLLGLEFHNYLKKQWGTAV